MMKIRYIGIHLVFFHLVFKNYTQVNYFLKKKRLSGGGSNILSKGLVLAIYIIGRKTPSKKNVIC